jgi:hypothetical protein
MVSSNAIPGTSLGVRSFRTITSGMSTIVAHFLGTDPAGGSPDNTVPLVRICSDRTNLMWAGQGCPGSGGTAPGLGFSGSAVLGSTTNVVLSNALPSTLAILAFGFDAAQPFPLSLTPVGMPGCWQYFTPAVALGLTANAAGVASYPQAIPFQPSLAGSIIFAQYYALDALANSAGIVSTNLGRLQPGW